MNEKHVEIDVRAAFHTNNSPKLQVYKGRAEQIDHKNQVRQQQRDAILEERGRVEAEVPFHLSAQGIPRCQTHPLHINTPKQWNKLHDIPTI